MEKLLKDLERKIAGGINAIEKGVKSPKEAAIGSYLNNLKKYDEVLFERLMNEYKSAVAKYNSK